MLAHGHDSATLKLLLLPALAHYVVGLLVALLVGASAALGFAADEHTPGRAHFAAELETMAWQGACAWLLLGWVHTVMGLLANPV